MGERKKRRWKIVLLAVLLSGCMRYVDGDAQYWYERWKDCNEVRNQCLDKLETALVKGRNLLLCPE